VRETSGNNDVDSILVDLSSQTEIKKLAHMFKEKYERLHVLVNNAGIIMNRRVLSVDGIELTFAVNYLAYFLLTRLLLDVMIKSIPSRIINVTSAIHRSVQLDLRDLLGNKAYNRDLIYAKSKLADVYFTYELARRLAGTGVSATCVCPGAVSTGIWKNSSSIVNFLFKHLVKSPAQGAALPVYLASSPEMEGVTGRYFETRGHLRWSRTFQGRCDCRAYDLSCDAKLARDLWETSCKLTALST
jgi:NAD(P)-dependent dehydrogenase (short-subunit alcohol dehydrogenase family)